MAGIRRLVSKRRPLYRTAATHAGLLRVWHTALVAEPEARNNLKVAEEALAKTKSVLMHRVARGHLAKVTVTVEMSRSLTPALQAEGRSLTESLVDPVLAVAQAHLTLLDLSRPKGASGLADAEAVRVTLMHAKRRVTEATRQRRLAEKNLKW